MKEVTLQDATSALAEYVQHLESEPVILTARGRPVAALISLKGVDAETIAVSTNPAFMKIIHTSRRQIARTGGVTVDQVRKRLSSSAKRSRKAAKR